MSSLQLKLLGGFAASLPSGQPIEIAGKKNQALLAYLALNDGKRASREKLIALLWSDRGEAQGRNSLRQALAALKAGLAGIEPVPLVLEGDSVALHPAAVSTDVARFRELASSDSVEDLRHAAKLYEGDLLEGITVRDPAFDDWLGVERPRLRESAIAGLSSLVERLTGTEAIATGRRLVDLDPLREASHRALMQAYANAGEKSLAVRQYAICSDLLKAELGVKPAKETEELRQRILEEERKPAASQVPAEASPVTAKAITIAVLPFVNLSGEAEQEYFADGLTEDLIASLAKSTHMHVIARNTAFQYKNQALNMQQLGRELGARYLVEGSVRRSANRIRVTAQLIDSDSGAHLWAERFDRELTDIFLVQDEIVHAVSAQLGYALIEAAVTGQRGIAAESLTAYDHVLRSRAAWRRGAAIETRDHLLKAVESDPDCAAALAFLAFLYSEDLAMQTLGVSLEAARKLSESYAEKAIAHDEGEALVHHLVGTAFLGLGRLEKAKHHLELARSLNPYWPNTTINLGCTIAFMGSHREGLAMIEGAFSLEPRLAPAMRAVPMYVHYLMRQYDEAIADFERIDNAAAFMHLVLAMCLAQAGRTEEAKQAKATFDARRSPQYDIAGFARCYCEMVRLPEDKEQWLEGLRKLGYKV